MQAEPCEWIGARRRQRARRRYEFDRIEWHFAPAELARGAFRFRVGADSNDVVFNSVIGRGWSRWIVGNTEARIAAPRAPIFLPLLGAWRPEGTVLLTSLGMRYTDDGKVTGSALVTWSDAALSLSDVRPLGKYVIEVNADDGPVALVVKTVDGALARLRAWQPCAQWGRIILR